MLALSFEGAIEGDYAPGLRIEDVTVHWAGGQSKAGTKGLLLGLLRPAAGVVDMKNLLPNPGEVAFVYLPFSAPEAGRVTFGFGADWEYEAYLDGVMISETLSRGGNAGIFPPGIRDHLATVDVQRGEHLLVVRFLRGMASALLAVGGPREMKDDRAPAPGSAILVYRRVTPGK